MKQTTEEVAYDYATEKTKFRKDVLKEVDADSYVSRHADCMEDFQRGYNYCKEQSPWISVKDRLPEELELVLCRMKSNGAIVNGYIFISPDGYPCVSTLPDFEFEDYGGYVCDMWMSIPSFDEILEANKDVLHRIKENED